MRNKKLNLEIKKPNFSIMEKKIDLMSPIYLPRKISDKNRKSPINTFIIDNCQAFSTKNKKCPMYSLKNNFINSIEAKKSKKIKNNFIQKQNSSNNDFISEIFLNFNNKDLNTLENKENIKPNYNNKYNNIYINLNKSNCNISKLENNSLNIDNIMIQNNNNNLYSSIPKKNYIKRKIISIGNRKKNVCHGFNSNNKNDMKIPKDLNMNDNRTQRIRKKLSYYKMNDKNCSDKRGMNSYFGNYMNSSNNINSSIKDNSYIGNMSKIENKKISNNISSENSKYIINNNKVNINENKINNIFLDNIYPFKKIKAQPFYKSPINKSKIKLENDKSSIDFQENRNLIQYKANLIRYPSSRDSTFNKLSIKNNLNNQNSYFSLNYTNTDTNDNISIDSANKKIMRKMKKGSIKNVKKRNLCVKINKEKLLKKSNIIKENEYKFRNKIIKTEGKSTDKDKQIVHRTLSNCQQNVEKDSRLDVYDDDIIIRIIKNKELCFKKEKKMIKSNSCLNYNKIYKTDTISTLNKNKYHYTTSKKKLKSNEIKDRNNEKENTYEIKEITLSKDSQKNMNKGSSESINQKYNSYTINKSTLNSSFVLNEEKNTNSGVEQNTNNDLNNTLNNINLYMLYVLESKLKVLLTKINSYQICYNECQDWISYFFGNDLYEQELNIFEQNKKQILYYLKFEVLCFFMCYDISFNKNYSQTSILLKTIFNLLHKNYLSLISFIIRNLNEKNETVEKNYMNSNNYIDKMIIIKKLQEIIKNELKMNNFGIDNLDETAILEIFSDNFKQIKNYYEMIIENIYQNKNELNKKNCCTFPECLKLNILKINDKKKSYIISEFFKNSLKSIDLYNIKEFKLFYNLFLNKSTDSLFIQQYYNNKRMYSLIPCPPSSPINHEKIVLPPIDSEKYNYSIILDLDETLIFLEKEYYTFNNNHNTKNKNLTLRPGLFNFLDRMKKIYEIILFTFSSPEYANPIIELIEKDEKYFEHKLYIQHASYYNNEYVKNIHDLGRNLKNTLIIDNNINNIHKSNRDNSICIKPFYGDMENEKNTLQLLGNVLNKIRYDAEITGDIAKSLKKEKYYIITEICSNLEE